MSGKIIALSLVLFSILNANNNAEETCKKNIDTIRIRAEEGDASKQYLMGIIYKNGLCVKKDSIKSFKYFSMSNFNGYLLAKFDLAEMYYYGEGTKINYKKSYELYNKILIDSHRDAIIKAKLGYMYLSGKGVDKNLSMAKKLYEESAESGHLDASYNLGLMYMSGLGTDKNISKAIEYLNTPATSNDPFYNGQPKAKYYLARALYEQNNKKYSDMILKLIAMSAIEGFVGAQVALGANYIDGKDLNRDMKKAKYWIQKAKKQNNAKAIKLWNQYKLWKY